jgi:glycosyltransferase involved in cell wall biosynthesis
VQTKLTIIYDYFSPAYKAGGPSQSLANLVSAIKDDFLLLNVICSNRDLDGTLLDVPVDRWIAKRYTYGAEVWYSSNGSAKNLENLVDKESTIFINSIYSHHFNYPGLISGKAKRKIVSPRGMLDPGSISQKSWKKKLYLQYWKLTGLHKKCEFHASSEQEKDNIQKVFGMNVKVWMVPNFPRVIDYQVPGKQSATLNLVTIALISPMKNHLLILQALKDIKSPVNYHIYGPVKDAGYWNECLNAIKQLPGQVKVTYHGDVLPSDVPKALEPADVAILPSRSENFGHSIFEAFTAGKPVITSHTTPWNQLEENKAGLNVDPGNNMELVKAIEFFAGLGQEDFKSWSQSARKYALGKVDIESIKAGYLEMFGMQGS